MQAIRTAAKALVVSLVSMIALTVGTTASAARIYRCYSPDPFGGYISGYMHPAPTGSFCSFYTNYGVYRTGYIVNF